jgi:TusA-related sulfurtransferase
MTVSSRKLRVDVTLDVRGVPAPEGYQQAVARLRELAEDAVLELYIDEGEALRTVPYGLRAEGHEILVSEPAPNGVRLLVKKRSLIAP